MDQLCPFCYHAIDRRRLWYVCNGIAAPGRPDCPKAVNPLRERETQYGGEMYPAFPPPQNVVRQPRRTPCPQCGGMAGQRACPCCNTPLPPGFGQTFSPLITMIGARKTGKTVYLTVLAQQLGTTLPERFDASIWLHGEEARRWVTDMANTIFDKGRLPALTEQRNGRSEPLVYEWRRRTGRLRRRYRSTYLSFLDTAGESLGTETGIQDLKFLAKGNAFILLLDPFTLPKAAELAGLAAPESPTLALDVLNQVTTVLRNAYGLGGNDEIQVPVAVAFAKIDALRDHLGADHAVFSAEWDRPTYDKIGGTAVHEAVRALVLSLGGQKLDRVLERNYSVYRYFVVSSLGRPPDYDGGTVARGGVRPHRVAEPLVWLLNQFKVVPTGRRQ